MKLSIQRPLLSALVFLISLLISVHAMAQEGVVGESESDKGQAVDKVAPAPTPAPATPATNSAADPAKSAPAASTAPSQKTTASSTSSVMVSGIRLPAEKANPVRITKFDKPPVIDGTLDDEVWKQAAVLK